MSPNLRRSRFLIQRQPAALEAIRRHFCDYGCSPSFRELAHRIGVQVCQIRRLIDRLVANGDIGWTPGKARSITLPRRFANASNSELLLELRRRGLPIAIASAGAPAGSSAWPQAVAAPGEPAVAKVELDLIAHADDLTEAQPGE